MIGFSQERRAVLLSFDALRTRHHGQHRAFISDELRTEIVRLLKRNFSWKKIEHALGISSTILRRVALPLRASTWKCGRGRRFTPETIEQIKQAILTEKTMGDYENRRHRKKLTTEQLVQARAQVANGARWRDAAKKFNVSPATLLSNIKFRKRAAYRHFTSEEERAILKLVRRGVGKRTIAHRFGRPRSSVYLFLSRRQAKASV